MQQSFNIEVPANFNISENAEDMQRFIETLFILDSSAYRALTSALQYENKPKFGPSTISNIHFMVERFDPKAMIGRVRISYDMLLTFGCEDFTKDHHNQHSYYNFNIDDLGNSIDFSSDILEERSPAEEF